MTDSQFMALGIHVDDMLVAADSAPLEILKDRLRTNFEITDMGNAKLFVGIQIDRHSADYITIHQERYIKTIIERFNMQDSHIVSTPLDHNTQLVPTDDEKHPTITDVPYQALIGSLMYAAVGTRPDIAFAAQALSQFNTSHAHLHWTAAKHVLRYLKGTQNSGISFRAGTHSELQGFSDADWGQSRID